MTTVQMCRARCRPKWGLLCSIALSLALTIHAFCQAIRFCVGATKVIINKWRGEVYVVELDTIECVILTYLTFLFKL